MRWIAAGVLGVGGLLQGCHPVKRCDDKTLQTAATKVAALQEELPSRVGLEHGDRPVGDYALEGILQACPGLPPGVRLSHPPADPRTRRDRLPTLDDLVEARTSTCANITAFRIVRYNHAALPGNLRDHGQEYDVCDLQRFALTDRLTYALSDDNLTSFMLYDHATRQHADPSVLRPMVRETFARAPFDLTLENLERLPSSNDDFYRGDSEGIGLRVTRTDVEAPGFDPVPLDGLVALRPALVRQRDRWLELVRERRDWHREPPALLIAADADVDARTLVTVVDFARLIGFDSVSALLSGPLPRLGSVYLSWNHKAPHWGDSSRSEAPSGEICIGAATAHVEVDGVWTALDSRDTDDDDAWRPGPVYVEPDVTAARLAPLLAPLGARSLHLLPDGDTCTSER